MTIAVSVKVHDGVVLAADSASTLVARQPDGSTGVINVYDNANKIVNLVKGLPLGIITWGSGSIGAQSMTSIYKDLRWMFVGEQEPPSGESWKLDAENYSVEDVAQRVRSYVYDQLYVRQFAEWDDPPALGMVVASYSAKGSHAEEYVIEMDGAGCAQPAPLRGEAECGFTVSGQPNGVLRLVTGVDPRLQAVLEQSLGVPSDQSGQAVEIIRQQLGLPLVHPAMPFQDALDLAEFFVDLTIRLTRFAPGPSTVGGPIEVAGITRHEGFKWIKRKYYYSRILNPQELG